MSPTFDVFQQDPDGSVVWRGTAASLEEAKAQIEELAANSQYQYFIMNLNTGRKLMIKRNEGATVEFFQAD